MFTIESAGNSPAFWCKSHNVPCVIVSEVLHIVHVQIFCMEIKDPKDTAMIDLNIEPAYVGTPFSTLLTNPAYPQLPGETSCLLSHYSLLRMIQVTAAMPPISHPYMAIKRHAAVPSHLSWLVLPQNLQLSPVRHERVVLVQHMSQQYTRLLQQ